MTSTTGLYVQRLQNSSQIHTVQVRDSAGMDRPVDPELYVQRGYLPPIDTLPELESFTRDRYLAAISAAFDDVHTFAPVGTWQVFVECKPKREIVLMDAFVARNIRGGGMQPEDLTKHLRFIPDSSWAKLSDGTLSIVLN